MLNIIQFPCLNDNYGFIINDTKTGKSISIDSPDGNKIIEVAKKNNLKIDEIWNTHWHADHAGGNEIINNEFSSICLGPQEVSKHGFLQHKSLKAGDEFSFGDEIVKIIDLSGHTLGQIGYWFTQSNKIFLGDALFVLGCGRLFEGSAELAHSNLENLAKLPIETEIYCAHEYSLANAIFCKSLKLSNAKLAIRIKEIEELSAKKIPTVPTKLGLELETNPFLLADFDNLRKDLGISEYNRAETYAHIRKAKDNF